MRPAALHSCIEALGGRPAASRATALEWGRHQVSDFVTYGGGPAGLERGHRDGLASEAPSGGRASGAGEGAAGATLAVRSEALG
jgi:hypothetical protein